mgnify:CR=1 FL=1
MTKTFPAICAACGQPWHPPGTCIEVVLRRLAARDSRIAVLEDELSGVARVFDRCGFPGTAEACRLVVQGR